MKSLWWTLLLMTVAMVLAVGPLLWALVLDHREARFGREVLRDIEGLPVVEYWSDEHAG